MRKKLTLLYLLIGISWASAQTKITGTVLSAEDGTPVIGATVSVKGTSTGTITDTNGKFTLSVSQGEKTTVIISYIGMTTKEEALHPNMRVSLSTAAKSLEEVIVVAYGTVKKNSFTGAATTVTGKSMENRPITTAVAALEGNTSGVQVTSSLGQPGEAATIRIRGFGSVNASNDPLYVVDGAIYNGNMSNLNPADIESMTVLKDAASTSLYGSSAGNGVVLITTKKGIKEGSHVTLNITQGWSSRAYKDYATVNAYQYYPLQWQMLKNAYITAGYTSAVAATTASAGIVSKLQYNPFVGVADASVVGTDGTLNSAANTLKWGDDLNWEEAAFKKGYRQEYNLGYSTKTDKSDTYASIGYLKDKGYMLKTNFERYSGRLNYNTNPFKFLKGGLNLGTTRSNSDYSTSISDNTSSYSNLTRFIRTMAPIYPIHKHDLSTGAYLDAYGNATTDPDKYVYDYDGTRLSNNGRDAIVETLWNSRAFTRTNTTAHPYITLTPVSGLNVTANYSYENSDVRKKEYENPYVGDGTAGPGRLSITSTRSLTETFNQLISYTRSINQHNFDILVGHENYQYKYEYFYSMKTQEIVANVYDLANFVKTSQSTSYTNEYKKEGYFARLNYDFDNKYYLSASYRRDGTSRFSKNNRWGNFYSVGGSWRISQENFIKSIKWVNNLKVRSSWGQTGNDAVLDDDGYQNYYAYQTLYTLGINNGTEGGTYFSNIANSNLKWETQVSADVAVEFGLFDRVNGTIEFFNKASKDLLFNVSQPTSTGIASITQNIGSVRNQGIEFDLNFNIYKNKDWTASFGVNGTIMNNKLTRLPDENRANGIISGSKKLMEGHSIYEFWLMQWWGVDPDNGNGLYFLDTEKYNAAAGTLTSAVAATVVEKDGVKLTKSYAYAKYDYSGSAIPDIYGGFNFNIGYKGFELGTVFSYSLGGKILDTNYQAQMSVVSYGYAMSTDLLKAWKSAGDVTAVPRLDASSTHTTNIGQTYSTRWLVSSDYLNLRSINLSYNLPKRILEKVMLSSARLSISAENLFMLKARQGLNPQASYNGITYNEYLPARTITFGLNAAF
jgi:TonB-linked SusC/RagA family outer membrane protein